MKNPVLLYVAQWSGSLAVLSAAAFASFLSGNFDRASLPERVRAANDRTVATSEEYAAMPCAQGGTLGIRYAPKPNLRAPFGDMNPNVKCGYSSSD